MSQKYVLVTGCSADGVGHGIALEFLKHNFHVFATARTLSKMAELCTLSNVTPLQLDVTSSESIESVVEKVHEITGGHLDYLINNAGAGRIKPIIESSLEDHKRDMETNYFGAVALTQAFLPSILKVKGCVVNIGSMSSSINTPFNAPYAASKAALKSWSESLRYEMMAFGVRIIYVSLGVVDTNFANNGVVYKCPSDSLYKPVEFFLNDCSVGKYGLPKMSVEDASRKIVKDAVNGGNGLTYRGSLSTITRITVLFPMFIIDYSVIMSAHLGVLIKAARNGVSTA